MAEIRKVFHCDWMWEDSAAYWCTSLKLTCQSRNGGNLFAWVTIAILVSVH